MHLKTEADDNTNRLSVIDYILAGIVIFVFVFFDNSAFSLLVGGLFVLFLLAKPDEVSWMFLAFLIPSNEFINVLGGTSIMIIFMLLYSVKSIIYILLHNQEMQINGTVLFAILLVTMSLIAQKLGLRGHIANTSKCLVFTYYVNNALRDVTNNNDKAKIEFYYKTFLNVGLGVLFAGCISILRYGIPSLGSRWSFTPETTINAQAIICGLTISNILYCLVYYEYENYNLRLIILIILACTCFGLLTKSRSFILIVLCAVFLIIVFSNSFSKLMKIAAAICAIIALLLILYISSATFRELCYSIVFRFVGKEDISNGRYDLWEATIRAMNANKKYLIFGAGDYTVLETWNKKHSDIKVAHNVFIESWVVYGYLGCTFLVGYWGTCLKTTFFKNRNEIVKSDFIPIIIFFVSFLYSHHFIGKCMTTLFFLSFLPFTIHKTYKLTIEGV